MLQFDSEKIMSLSWDSRGGRLLTGGNSITMWCDKVTVNTTRSTSTERMCVCVCLLGQLTLKMSQSAYTCAHVHVHVLVQALVDEALDASECGADVLKGSLVPLWIKSLSAPVHHLHFSPGLSLFLPATLLLCPSRPFAST